MKAKIVKAQTLQAKIQDTKTFNAIMRWGLVIHENIELSKQWEYIVWRTVGKLDWKRLIPIDELKVKWDKGNKWDKWYTPQKWIDYFDWYSPKKWIDYFDWVKWKDGSNGKDWDNWLSAFELWKLEEWNKDKKLQDFWNWLRREWEHIVMAGALNVVPIGWTTGQVLKKSSNTDFDLEWGTWWGGSSITLKTNWTDNWSQTILNLKQGTNITLTDDWLGWVTIDATWGGWSWDVVWPASSISNHVVFFDGITGKLIKDSWLTLSWTNTGDQDLSPYFNKSVDDTDGITVGTTNKFATAAEKTKLWFITVTQAVDLDAIETNANNVPWIKTKTDFITVTQAVDLDAIETNSNASKVKTDFITVTQAVDLDTIESDTATNNAKVTNATHTGEMTWSGALTADQTLVSNKTLKSSLAGTEEVLINDAWTLKKTTAQDIADLWGWWWSQPYTALSADATITQWNVYWVTASTVDITLTLSDGTSAWQTLTVKKIDSTDYSVFINNANIDWETSLELTIEDESIDLYRTGTAFIIK